MSLLDKLLVRSNSKCELCSNSNNLNLYEIQPQTQSSEHTALILCETCKDQIDHKVPLDSNHWHCLNETMWSEYSPIQVMAFRVLSQLDGEIWARDLLEQLYLDDSMLEWAKEGLPKVQGSETATATPTLDSNGTKLSDGDSVTLIKDLEVKGGGFTAKRGTLVKNISLTTNPKHIEGRVNGIQIVLVAAFLKKA